MCYHMFYQVILATFPLTLKQDVDNNDGKSNGRFLHQLTVDIEFDRGWISVNRT